MLLESFAYTLRCVTLLQITIRQDSWNNLKKRRKEKGDQVGKLSELKVYEKGWTISIGCKPVVSG